VPSRAEPARPQTPDTTGGGTPGGAPDGTGIAAPGGAGNTRRAERQLPSWLVAGIPVVAALVVGGYRLGGASLWRDEAYTLEVAQRSTGQIFNLLLHVDAVHGPYYLGMHAVIRLFGSSEAALRLPSLVATSLAAGILALLGRRLARASGLPAPAATGLLAGLLQVAAPQTTYYAQDARPYGLVTLFAVAATYLLIVAVERGGARWWAAYAAAIALTGVASLFALLILAAHGVTLLLTQARGQARARGQAQGQARGEASPAPRAARLLPWLAAAGAGVVVVSPLIALGYGQDNTLSWVGHPGFGKLTLLVTLFAGSHALIPVVLALALCGVAAGMGAGRLRQITVVTVALPWLLLPPFILLAVSVVKPVYVERYVVFCQPALALLCAAGVAWLGGLVAASAAGRRTPALAWAAPAVILVALTALVIGPQRSVRLTSARPDNLRGVSAVIAANQRPGDAVFYLPSEARVVSMGYPAPFRKLRDLALKASPVASNSLTGTQVWAPVLASRFTGVHRVWLVQWAGQLSARPDTKVGREELALVHGMHPVRRWTVQSVVLTLYAT
jgi:mannosyltransferase